MTESKDTLINSETLTKADIITHLMNEMGLTKQQGRMIVNTLFSEMTNTLAAGTDIKLSGFGNFVIREKPARPGRNPKTKEAVTISARRVVTFKAGHKLKEQINQHD